MTPERDSDGEDHRPRRAQDLPPARDEVRRQDDHRDAHDDRRDEREPEPAQDLRHLEPEVRLFDLLLRRAPRDVVRAFEQSVHLTYSRLCITTIR